MIETMAINELDRRRKRLEEYQIKARFALAESYDRATKAQLDADIAEQLKKQAPAENTEMPVKEEPPVGEDSKVHDDTKDDKPVEDEPVKSSSSFKDKLLNR